MTIARCASGWRHALEGADDPRVERYRQLLAVINGWPAPPSLALVFAWLSAALRTVPAGYSKT
ncbi:hypothetical protein [Nocardia sp. NPDC057455]|uniref:hypothetical protein n=1 Tax=Nocardia sp. NPDC057455 TaxID=3346138 RepID=UPI003671035A